MSNLTKDHLGGDIGAPQQDFGISCQIVKGKGTIRVGPFQQIVINSVDIAGQERIGKDGTFHLWNVRTDTRNLAEIDVLVFPRGLVCSTDKEADKTHKEHSSKPHKDNRNHADGRPTVQGGQCFLTWLHPFVTGTLECGDKGKGWFTASIPEKVLDAKLVIHITGLDRYIALVGTVQRLNAPRTDLRRIHRGIGFAQIVKGKAGPVVTGDDCHGHNGQGKEKPATQHGHAGAQVWLAFPGTHQTKAIHKEIDYQGKGAHEESARVYSTVPKGEKNDLGHVRVPFGQFHGRPNEIQVHGIL